LDEATKRRFPPVPEAKKVDTSGDYIVYQGAGRWSLTRFRAFRTHDERNT